MGRAPRRARAARDSGTNSAVAAIAAAARRMLAPLQRSEGEDPYAIQSELQETMQELVGLIRTGTEIEEARRRNLRRVWGMAAPDNYVMLRLADSLGFVPGGDPGVFHLDLTKETSRLEPRSESAA